MKKNSKKENILPCVLYRFLSMHMYRCDRCELRFSNASKIQCVGFRLGNIIRWMIMDKNDKIGIIDVKVLRGLPDCFWFDALFHKEHGYGRCVLCKYIFPEYDYCAYNRIKGLWAK